MNKSRLKVKIFGTEYALKAETDSKYIEETADYVNRVMSSVAARYQEQSDTRVAVLAALNIAEELFEVQGHVPENLSDRTLKLADALQAALKD